MRSVRLGDLQEVALRTPLGRCHGDCGACEIYHAVLDGSAADCELDECQECFLSGRTFDHRRSRSILSGLVRDGRSVCMPDGSRMLAEQALSLFDSDPAAFRISAKLTF